MKIGQYCQRQRCKHVESEQFWHTFASRGFVSDSWAFLSELYLCISCTAVSQYRPSDWLRRLPLEWSRYCQAGRWTSTSILLNSCSGSRLLQQLHALHVPNWIQVSVKNRNLMEKVSLDKALLEKSVSMQQMRKHDHKQLTSHNISIQCSAALWW